MERNEKLMSIFGEGQNHVFIGAGTSLSSGIPIVGGREGLIYAILTAIGLSESEISDINESSVPFETIMANLSLGSDITSLLNIFDVAISNPTYWFLAQAVKNGMIQGFLTTNFDQCLETALKENDIAYRVYSTIEQFSKLGHNENTSEIPVIKLHGCISNSEQLGITINQVGKNEQIHNFRSLLANIFQGNSSDRVVFLGYSGSDKFDINPILQDIFSSPENSKEVLFVEHSTSDKGILPMQLPLPPFLHGFGGEKLSVNTDDYIESQRKRYDFGAAKELGPAPDWRKWFNIWSEYDIDSPNIIAGGLFADISNYERAITKLKIAALEVTTDKTLCTVWSNLINVYTSAGRFYEAKALANEIEKYDALEDPHSLTILYLNIAKLYNFTGDKLKSKALLKTALKHSKNDTNDSAKHLRFRIMLNLAAVLIEIKDFRSFRNLSEEIEDGFAEHGELQGRVSYLRAKAQLHIYDENIVQAESTLREARDLASNLAFREFEVATMLDEINLMRSTGRYPEAVLLSEHAAQLSLKYNLEDQVGIAIGNKALAMMESGDLSGASGCFSDAVDQSVGNHQITILGNYIMLLDRMGNSSEALSTCEQLIFKCSKRKDYFALNELRRAYLNKSKIYSNLESDKLASEAARESLLIARELNNEQGISNAACNLAIAKSNLGEHADALIHALEARSIFSQMGNENAVDVLQRVIERSERNL